MPNQIVNHFQNNSSFTTKIGLCQNLKSLIWTDDIDVDKFYPKSYNLSDPIAFEDFVEEFKISQV